MKKALLLSVVASVAVMAGGDIAPVPAPVVEEVSAWDFSGQAVLYYQTLSEKDFLGTGDPDLFSQTSSMADFGLQLRAVNKDVFWGIGFGGEVSGLATLNLENSIVSNVMQGTGGSDPLTGGWISQLYATYGFGNTSIKAGRQELPKALSPFAFSEKWNVFSNTFDSVLVVNTDIPDTTVVGAYVYGGNFSGIGAGNDMSDFYSFNEHDGVWMLTLQNKSIEGLTLTGSWYYAADFGDNNLGLTTGNDVNILWGDAKYAFSDYLVAGQLGSWMDDDFADDSFAWGLKAAGNFDMFSASLAYTSVDDGGIQGLTTTNVGGVKTPLYTQLILNQGYISYDSDTFVARAGLKALGGKFGAAYNYSDLGSSRVLGSGEYTEFDLTYKTKVFNGSTTLFAGYIYQDLSHDNVLIPDFDQNVLRFWGRYNF
jgi:hypothetical protein